ncbi:MAG: hypothetical protein IKS41_07460 [Alphaproteobacteria bacterium]|nr:hypothetical protein [Alphaproteobacteria bacterium]
MITKERQEFNHALRSRNVSEIIRQINIGNNINTDVGVRVFDVLLSLKSLEAEKGFKVVLNSPSWNPNYRAADTWHPEERAMFHHREDLAIRVISHPNFDKKEYPRVIRSANLFKADKVLDFLAQRTRS